MNNIIEIALRMPEPNQNEQLQNVLSFINLLSDTPRILPDASLYADDGDLMHVYNQSFGLYAHDLDVIILNRSIIALYGEYQNTDEGMTILHEVMHWTGHASRLNRDIAKAQLIIKANPKLLSSMEWAFIAHNEEIIAELAACRIGVMLGYDMTSLEIKLNHYRSLFPYANFDRCNSEADRVIAYLNELAKPIVKAA